MDRPKMSDYDDILNTPLEKYSFITDNITTNSSSPLSPITTQSVLNQFPPTVTTSNEPTNTTTTTTTTAHSGNINKTNQKVSFVRANPTISGQGLVKKVERNITRPFTSTQHNTSAKLQRTNTKPPLMLESLVKETGEFMSNAFAGSKNDYLILEKKYDELKLENAKLHDEINQLKHHQVTLVAKIDALTPPETRQTSQLHNNEQIVTNDTNPDQLYNQVEIGHNVDSEYSQALPDATEMQIKQLPEDDSLSNQASDILSSDQIELKLNSNSVFQCIATVKEHVSPSVSGQIDVLNKLTDERAHQQVIGANVDQQTMPQSNGTQANTNEVVNAEDGLVDQNEHNAHLNDEDNISDNEHSIAESNKPSTSEPRSNRISSTQPTGSNRRNLTKHKQTQSTRSVKRSKKTIENEDGDKEEDIATEDGVDEKFKVLHLNCTEQNCEVKLNSLEQLYQHLRTLHRLLPLRCFALNCNVRCDNSRQIGIHIKSQHSIATKFECHICHKEFGSQKKTLNHWYQCHLTGQFECNLSECYQVLYTRTQVHTHQLHKHCAQSERFNCPHDDCEASFVTKSNLEQHEMIHLNSNPFHCGWPQCNSHSNRRSRLVRHIRTQHFGLPLTVKEQNSKNIVDNRDPNEFVLVIEE